MKLMTLWKAWREPAMKCLVLLGALGSLLTVLLAFLPSPTNLPPWSVALLVSAAFFVVVLVILEFRVHRGCRLYATDDRDGIKDYMHDWIEHGGRVAIWTRDLSWAQNNETRQLLQEKAKRKELILCLPRENDLATMLAEAGAEIYAYGTDGFEAPASRFTIAFFGRDGSRVAVGRAHGDTHIIEEFSAGEHPAFWLAADLVDLVRSQRMDRPST